jgi:hypothetical protein
LPRSKHGAHSVAHWAPAVLSWWYLGGLQARRWDLARTHARLLYKECFSARTWRAW